MSEPEELFLGETDKNHYREKRLEEDKSQGKQKLTLRTVLERTVVLLFLILCIVGMYIGASYVLS